MPRRASSTARFNSAPPLIPDGGSIILNASVAGSQGMPAFSVYSATKAAVRSFARSWTADLKERGIRVNVISPGPIRARILEGLADSEEQKPRIVQTLTAMVPLGRMGPQIGKAAVFLASDDASFVAGAELFVDGGLAQV
jgi:NAD(P)-dependent dehydrogenase (short-subunit alcohol dehydrogenase family)